MSKKPAWLTKGYEHVWLPYTQMQTAELPLPVVKAEGCQLELADGKKLIDGISSWWTACHGNNHPHIKQAALKQFESLPHVMFAGLANEPAYTLASRLAKLAPEGLERVFFTDSGSTSVETAMKMAVQYWHNKGERNRTKFLCFKQGYHGDTMGCMSLCDPEKGMHSALGHYMPMQYAVDIPQGEYSFSEFDDVLDGIGNTVAGVIIEPLVQCAGGMKFHTADVLAEIYRITKKHELLFIADEIAVGFGRTGYMFACNEAGISPDIMCVGKALTGGTMTLAATLATAEVFEGFLSETLGDALMSGPTYMANPLACAIANASLDLFEQEPRLAQVEKIESQLEEELAPCRELAGVKDVRVKGAIGVVQIDADWDKMFALRKQFVKEGVWLRPFGDVVYIMPPFVISEQELGKLTKAVVKILG